MTSGPYCPNCGKATTPLPSRGFGAPEAGCSDLECPGVHPYFVAQELVVLRIRLADLTNKFLLHQQEDSRNGTA